MCGADSCPPLLKLILVWGIAASAVGNNNKQVQVKGGGQECPPQTSLLPLFFFLVFVPQVESERRMGARACDLDGQFGLAVFTKEGIEGFQ